MTDPDPTEQVAEWPDDYERVVCRACSSTIGGFNRNDPSTVLIIGCGCGTLYERRL